MSFYQFLKDIQVGVGDDCRVGVVLWSIEGLVEGLEVRISWPNDFRYMFVLPERSIESEGFLEGFSKYTIEKAQRAFRIAEVGEE